MLRTLVLTLSLLLTFSLACDSSDDNTTGGGGNGGDGTIYPSQPDPTKNVSLASVDGITAGGTLRTGQTITFNLKVLNDAGRTINGLTSGFRIYSPDGVNWRSTTASIIPGTLDTSMFDLVATALTFSADGRVSDTVGFGHALISNPGMADGYDEVGWRISIGPLNSGYTGMHICLDSSWYRPSGEWLWAWSGGGMNPTWDGPHCWEIRD